MAAHPCRAAPQIAVHPPTRLPHCPAALQASLGGKQAGGAASSSKGGSSGNKGKPPDRGGGSAAAAAAAAPTGPRAEAVTAAINHALLLYLQRQHASALAVLAPLYEAVEGMYDGQTLRLCLLLVEVYLACGQQAQAASVLHFLEHSSGLLPAQPGVVGSARASMDDGGPSLGEGDFGGGGGGTNGATPQPGAPPRSATPRPLTPAPPPAELAAAVADAPAGPLFLPVLSRTSSALVKQVQALLEQQQQKQPQPQGSSPSEPAAAAAAPQQPLMPDVKLLLRLYKARLHINSHNHRAAKKELKTVLAALPGCPAALDAKAQLEAARHHPRKALKALGSLMADAEERSRWAAAPRSPALRGAPPPAGPPPPPPGGAARPPPCRRSLCRGARPHCGCTLSSQAGCTHGHDARRPGRHPARAAQVPGRAAKQPGRPAPPVWQAPDRGALPGPGHGPGSCRAAGHAAAASRRQPQQRRLRHRQQQQQQQ